MNSYLFSPPSKPAEEHEKHLRRQIFFVAPILVGLAVSYAFAPISVEVPVNIAEAGGSPLVAAFDLPGGANATSLVTEGNYAYVTTKNNNNGSEFYIFDITVTIPALVSSLDIKTDVNKVFVLGNHAYLATSNTSKELTVVNIANKVSPQIAGTYDSAGSANGLSLFASGTHVFLGTTNNTDTNGHEFYILDVSNPASILKLGSFEIGAKVLDIEVDGNDAYLATSQNQKELIILNIANPGSISEKSSFNTVGDEDATSLDYKDGKVYLVTESNGAALDFYIFGVTQTPITILGGANLNSNNSDVLIYGDKAYIGTKTNSKQLIVIDIANPVALLRITNYNIGQSVLQVAARESYIYLATLDSTKEFQVFNLGFPLTFLIHDMNGNGTTTISTYGDSNTRNFGLPPEDLYPSQLQVLVNNNNLGWTISNNGFPGRGATATSTLAALLAQTGSDFKEVFFIALGQNDFSWGSVATAAEVRDRLATLVSMVNNANPPRVAIVATVAQFGTNDPRVDELNSLLINDRARFPFLVDFHTIVSSPADYVDSAHFNAQGHAKRAAALFSTLFNFR